ncbi:MAG: hypothetical protein ABEI99_06855 [Halobaculum sp.]
MTEGLSRRRDALLAGTAACGVVGAAWLTAGGPLAGLRTLSNPVGLAVGFLAAVLLELLFARFPEIGRDLWRRRSVRIGGTLLVAVVGPGAVLFVAWTAGERAASTVSPTLSTLAGGLLGYALLLALIVSETVSSPETWFENR